MPSEQEYNYKIASVYQHHLLYQQAYSYFCRIKNYKDVDSIILSERNFVEAREMRAVQIRKRGEFVTLGAYPQTINGDDSTLIEWLVLDVQGNKSLLISRYALDCKLYNSNRVETTWENSSIRKWLNTTFFNKAFSVSEQSAILPTSVDNSKGQGYSGWNADGGYNTQDKIFLLSFAEAWKYFENDTERECEATSYAKTQGAYTSSGNCFWWLRSPGCDQKSATIVNNGGSYFSNYVDNNICAVRPAFWLDLNANIF